MAAADWRVVIPCAGIGARMGNWCDQLNKALVPVANRPTIDYALEKIPREVTVVIALGYKGDLVREFLELTYSDRSFVFCLVDRFEGLGSGLRYSLLQCRSELQCPFVFYTNDAIILDDLPPPVENWAGYSDARAGEVYRPVCFAPQDRSMLQFIAEKGVLPGNRAYIGISGVKDYDKFWQQLLDEHEKGHPDVGEVSGMNVLPDTSAKYLVWHDAGSFNARNAAEKALLRPDDPFILPKEREAIWFCDRQVIKFSADPEFVSGRVQRASSLAPFVPVLEDHSRHFYTYRKIEGRIMSDGATAADFERLLKWLGPFWEPRKDLDTERWTSSCMAFYHDKTMRRLGEYFDRFGIVDWPTKINGRVVLPPKMLLESQPWDELAEGCPVRWHGDLHFNNILMTEDGFCLLDWRQDFDGLLDVGDLYYDLAKLLHGLIVSHDLIVRGKFRFEAVKRTVRFDFFRKHSLSECEEVLERWVISSGLDWQRVCRLAALVFINNAPLHEAPYANLLFYLGLSMLAEL